MDRIRLPLLALALVLSAGRAHASQVVLSYSGVVSGINDEFSFPEDDGTTGSYHVLSDVPLGTPALVSVAFDTDGLESYDGGTTLYGEVSATISVWGVGFGFSVGGVSASAVVTPTATALTSAGFLESFHASTSPGSGDDLAASFQLSDDGSGFSAVIGGIHPSTRIGNVWFSLTISPAEPEPSAAFATGSARALTQAFGPSPVPEPSGLASGVVALAAGLGVAWRRRARA